MLRLFALTGPDAGRAFHYEVEAFVLGRAGTPDRDLQYPVDATMSRQHANMRVLPEGLAVSVLDGAAPLCVGGSDRRDARLAWGTEWTVGATRFRADAWRASPPLETGLERRALSDFELGEEIGDGFSSVVYAAVDTRDGAALAIKVLRPEVATEEVVAMFVREAELHAALDHPNIVRIRCVGRDRADLFMGMDLVDGFDLGEHVGCEGPFSPASTRRIGLGVLRALNYAHSKGLVHRDVKPNNVMLDGDVPRVVDFGMAKHLWPPADAEVLTRTGEARGTPMFSAPECLRDAKRAGPTADVFAAGTTLYYALTGKPWFDETTYRDNFASAVMSGARVPLRERRPEIHRALAAVIEGAIHVRPEDRWPSAAAMHARLEAIGGLA